MSDSNTRYRQGSVYVDWDEALPDIKPYTPISRLQPERYQGLTARFPLSLAAAVVGMSETFVRKVCGAKTTLDIPDMLLLLEQDAFGETIVPRSGVIDYLIRAQSASATTSSTPTLNRGYALVHGNSLQVIPTLQPDSIRCVVTSTPYWGMRIYKQPRFTEWADGEICPYGHEQTPEGFVRHTTEILLSLREILTLDGSIWWNVMDTFNTRTQIRSNSAEALRAMQGKDARSWADHECRRYSAGHSYLKDGEQCMIPGKIAERASRLGFFVKSIITWAKTSTLPEPQESRVSKNLEYILHLTKFRTPLFNKEAYRTLPIGLGGRNASWETDKLSDVWTLSTSSGRDGHGAQFPIALPARCIALSTNEGDTVLDPFVGAGNSGVAARALSRRFIGIDVSEEYLATAEKRISNSSALDLGRGRPRAKCPSPSTQSSACAP